MDFHFICPSYRYSIMHLSLIFTHSLEKIFHQRELNEGHEITRLSLLKNESLSFQCRYFLQQNDDEPRRQLRYELTGELSSFISVRQVQHVPSLFPCYRATDDDYLTTSPGLFPDPLLPLPDKTFFVNGGYSGSLWLTVNPQNESLPAGKSSVCLQLSDIVSGEILGSVTLEMEVVAKSLPPQTLLHTEWLHTDCLADVYNIEVFSESWWLAVRHYVRCAVNNGVNMMLTPVFTPPLDTAIGGERTTVQLVGVTQTETGQYQFDFSALQQWVALCQQEGITTFEISHLFTQWGAHHAPKIMVYKGGQSVQAFGWQTDAHGPEYRDFLHAFLPALCDWLRAKGLGKHAWFHVSDEPKITDIEAYQRASDLIRPLIGDFPVLDALSDYAFYQQGLVENPVTASDCIEPFLSHQVPGLWTYYCCVQKRDVANRFFAQPSYRNRILGVQLYLYRITGFLHWGFNFYNSGHSLEKLNPYAVTDGRGAFPSGDLFVVYPGKDFQPVESLRLMVLREAFQDLRALQLLESLTRREHVEQLITRLAGMQITFARYPRNAQFLQTLRYEVNQQIAGA
ncbi:DUF4091 domain-containing protein [Scandinavium manionii]|uniref:DUF4091 domain-containing protein n=1 Tax=Scandinavium manionii TaxID=2926520 RepID=UPI002166754F|nr:DUF4091 domain-containing protein [Scandinavium manionii]MCS2149966.1 DUF4091 domain-containing protein [Scandinavium manionii]MCS2168346.1 DUF4091 domain-containing protein [Scandinavium manionii]